jgi:hypothetical protein
VLIGMALLCTRCSTPPAPAAPGNASTAVPPVDDTGAMADLQASEKWKTPSCRWLETGAWILAYRQETALYGAARDLGFIEMEQVGTGNRYGTPEPAWKIALTDAGRSESAKCGRGSTKPQVWGVPVSERRFVGGRRVGQDAYTPDRFTFEVEFDWVPTAVGERVRHVLTKQMTVQQGSFRTKVALRYSDRLIKRGSNGWWTEEIFDLAAVPR